MNMNMGNEKKNMDMLIAKYMFFYFGTYFLI